MKRPAIKLLLALLFLNLPGMVEADDHVQDESLVRAAFIFNVAKFTEWPKSVFTDEQSSLNLCTAGEKGLVPVLQHLEGRSIKGREFNVLPVTSQSKAEPCHLLYVAESESRNFQQYIDAVDGVPVLTISEVSGFIASGGMVKLYREAGRVRFIINLKAVRKQRLAMSSRLLRLAVIVGQELSP